MAREILVPLKRSDSTNEVIPFIEKIAQPRMKVVFVIRYDRRGHKGGDFEWWEAYWKTIGSRILPPSEAIRIMEQHSMEAQKRTAEKKVYSAGEALRKRGVEVEAAVCTGSLKKAVRSYVLNGDVDLIVTPIGSGHPILRLLHGTIRFFSPFSQPSSPPVAVLHPRAVF